MLPSKVENQSTITCCRTTGVSAGSIRAPYFITFTSTSSKAASAFSVGIIGQRAHAKDRRQSISHLGSTLEISKLGLQKPGPHPQMPLVADSSPESEDYGLIPFENVLHNDCHKPYFDRVSILGGACYL